MDNNVILKMDPTEMLEYLTDEFLIQLPTEITTADEMNEAAKLLLYLSNCYSYLCTLSSYAKIATREAKRSGDKQSYEDMVDRKDCIQNLADIVKQQYAAVSRGVTIRIENNNELKMTSNGYIT